MGVIDMVNGKLCETLPIEEIEQMRNEGYEQGRTDERKKILDILKTFTESDYNSKECKLLVSDLREVLWEGEQKNDTL